MFPNAGRGKRRQQHQRNAQVLASPPFIIIIIIIRIIRTAGPTRGHSTHLHNK